MAETGLTRLKNLDGAVQKVNLALIKPREGDMFLRAALYPQPASHWKLDVGSWRLDILLGSDL